MRKSLSWLLVAVLILGSAVIYVEFKDQFQPVQLKATLGHNPWAPLIFILAHVIVSLAFIPRTFMAIAGGVLFGIWYGIVLTLAGGMVGGTIAFILVRYVHRGIFALDGERGHAWVIAIRKRLEDSGWRGVAMVRLFPAIPHTASNYAFGLTEVSFTDYSIGSFIGLVPSSVFFVALGAAGGEALTGKIGWVEPTLIALAAMGVIFALPYLVRLLRRR